MNQKTACYISCSPSLLHFSGVFPTHNRSSLTSVFTHELHNTFFFKCLCAFTASKPFWCIYKTYFYGQIRETNKFSMVTFQNKRKRSSSLRCVIRLSKASFVYLPLQFFFPFLMCCTAVTVTLGLAYTSPTETFTGVHRRIREGSSPQLYMLLPRHTAAQELAANLLGKRAGEPKWQSKS